MKIVSLYKIWSGQEFLIPSIIENYNYVSKMVFVSSEHSWTGELGNDTLQPLQEWKSKYDTQDKIVILQHDTTNQEQQYKFGLDYIKKNIKDCTWVQLVDCDEVWDKTAWTNTLKFLPTVSRKFLTITCNMWTYIKSPLYRLTGNGEVCPVVFIRPFVGEGGPRYCKIPQRIQMRGVWVHHFALVRKNHDTVLKKIQTSIAGDNLGYTHGDLKKWTEEVWDKLPKGEVYHYLKGYEHLWVGISILHPESLPESCRELSFT